MTMNPLPPQAYTKETLLKAYHWLQQQPSHIKEMAMTPDLMVSLFLKASRDGDHVLERPSITNFKTELKNLAGLMGELEGPPTPKSPAPPPPPTAQTSSAASAPTPASAPLPQTPPQQTHGAGAMAKPVHGLPTTPTPSTPQGLDALSLVLLREVQERFNLSTETEAMRMLIKIGHAKAMSFFGDEK